MKTILKSMLAISLMAMLSSYANAQSKTKICFQTGTSVQSCQDVLATNPFPVTIANNPIIGLATTGGWTPLLLNSLAATVTTIKNTPGQLGKVYCYNPNAVVSYVQIFNLSSGNVTLGTTTPLNILGIAPTSSNVWMMNPVGDQYSAAISIAATTTASGLTAPNTALVCNVSYN